MGGKFDQNETDHATWYHCPKKCTSTRYRICNTLNFIRNTSKIGHFSRFSSTSVRFSSTGVRNNGRTDSKPFQEHSQKNCASIHTKYVMLPMLPIPKLSNIQTNRETVKFWRIILIWLSACTLISCTFICKKRINFIENVL